MYTVKDPDKLVRELGPVKSSIMGKFAKGTPPAGTPETFDLKGMATVMPFLIKGKILGKAKQSPFFENGKPIVTPKVLADEKNVQE
jgi:hypothetical protein